MIYDVSCCTILYFLSVVSSNDITRNIVTNFNVVIICNELF